MPRGVVTVQIALRESGAVEEFVSWYCANYIPKILDVSGVRHARVLAYGRSLGAELDDPPGALAIFDVEGADLDVVVDAIVARAAVTPVSGMSDLSRTTATLYVEPVVGSPTP